MSILDQHEIEVTLSGIGMTRKALLITEFSREVMIYAQYCFMNLVDGRLVKPDNTLPQVAEHISESMTKAFNKNYRVKFLNEYGDEPIELEPNLYLYIDADHNFSASLQ